MRGRGLPGKRVVKLELVSQSQFERTELNSTQLGGLASLPAPPYMFSPSNLSPWSWRLPLIPSQAGLHTFTTVSSLFFSGLLIALINLLTLQCLCFFRFFLNISIPDMVFKWLLTFVIEHTWRLRPTSFDGVLRPYRLHVHCCFVFIIVLLMSFSEGGILSSYIKMCY